VSALLEVENLEMHFNVGRGQKVHAVNGLTFSINVGESLGIVGESGSGKSTTGRLVLKLLEANAGSIRFRGTDITGLEGRALRAIRADMQVVFQEPYESLNPRLSVGSLIEENLLLHGKGRSRQERRARVLELMDSVGLRPDMFDRRPSELSGGQRQRVGIARAIATEPALVVLDEPTSALDVSVRAQVLELLLELQRDRNLSYLFISHDLSTIQYSCERVAVMYLGRIVETGKTAEVFANPRHPYTRALLSAVLRPEVGKRRDRIQLSGEMPSPRNLPPGCPFASRCPVALPVCSTRLPDPVMFDADHMSLCVRAEELDEVMQPSVA
jgi:oligopeptide/dipeptide ABC transporter ATP-binding protein